MPHRSRVTSNARRTWPLWAPTPASRRNTPSHSSASPSVVRAPGVAAQGVPATGRSAQPVATYGATVTRLGERAHEPSAIEPKGRGTRDSTGTNAMRRPPHARNASPSSVPRPPSTNRRCGGSAALARPSWARASSRVDHSGTSARPPAVARAYVLPDPSSRPPSSAASRARSRRTANPSLWRRTPTRTRSTLGPPSGGVGRKLPLAGVVATASEAAAARPSVPLHSPAPPGARGQGSGAPGPGAPAGGARPPPGGGGGPPRGGRGPPSPPPPPPPPGGPPPRPGWAPACTAASSGSVQGNESRSAFGTAVISSPANQLVTR